MSRQHPRFRFLEQSAAPTWLRTLLGIGLVLSILLRLYTLDGMVYWYDETMTSVRATGYVVADVSAKLTVHSEPLTVAEFLGQYQYPNPDRNLRDSWQSLAAHPEHSPLYYLLARLWLQLGFQSVLGIRLLSAIFGIVVIPAAFWLGSELFRDRISAWIFTILVAVSPFHILYAQEAREYSLWTLTILLSCAALLRSLRRPSRANWCLYSLTACLGLYAHPFTAFVLASHGIYTFWRVKLSRSFVCYLLASSAAILLFLPWLNIVIANFADFTGNTASVTTTRQGFLPLFWGLNLSRIWIDFNQGISPWSPLHYLSAALAITSFYLLIRHTRPEIWLFVVALSGVTGLALLGPDLLIGGRRSTITRYAVSAYLGIQVAIAAACAMNLKHKFWRIILALMAVCGILSILVSSHIPVWWHKSYAKSRHNPVIAQIINETPAALVVTSDKLGRVFSLAHLLDPEVSLQVLAPGADFATDVAIANNYEPIYLYRSTAEDREKLSALYRLEETYPWLWSVTPR
ncbi:MAG: glycosyltransferase family 39 protein [Cyanobacteria bacterium P01_H01_bin.15]